MNKIDSKITVQKLRDFHSRYGIPCKAISDNGGQRVSLDLAIRIA